MASLRKNIASQNFPFSLVTASNGAASTTTSTGSLTAFVTKDATQASAGGTFTYLGTGEWNYAPTQAETNCISFALYVTASSNIPFHGTVWTDDFTIPADALLDRDMSVGVDSGSTAVRTPRQAWRALRNKIDTSTGTLNVYKEDDATVSWTGTVTSASSAVPIVTVDPAGP